MAEKPATDIPSKSAPAEWVSIVDDVFPQWRDRLESGDDTKDWPSDDAKNWLDALLRERRTCAAIQYTSDSGEITRRDIQPAEFWRDRLGLDRDADGVDRLRVDYRPYVHDDYSLVFGWSRDFVVRRSDVARWERLHPELAPPPPPSKEPTSAPSEELNNNPRQKPGPKPDFEWEKIEAKCYELMDDNGDFMQDDKEWDCQARLETELRKFCDAQGAWGRLTLPCVGLLRILPR